MCSYVYFMLFNAINITVMYNYANMHLIWSTVIICLISLMKFKSHLKMQGTCMMHKQTSYDLTSNEDDSLRNH